MATLLAVQFPYFHLFKFECSIEETSEEVGQSLFHQAKKIHVHAFAVGDNV